MPCRLLALTGTLPTGFDYWEIYWTTKAIITIPILYITQTLPPPPGYATDLMTEKSIARMQSQTWQDKPFFLMVHHKAPHRNWMPPLRYVSTFDPVEFPLPDSYFPDFDSTQIAAQRHIMTIYKGTTLK